MDGMTITEFILARVAEDEKEARAMDDDLRKYPPSVYEMAQVPMLDMGSPERVLAECEAKRRIVERASKDIAAADAKAPDQITRSFDAGAAHEAHNVLLDLARIWADHEDYRQEWR